MRLAEAEFPEDPDWDWLRQTFPAGTGLRFGVGLCDVIGQCTGRLAYLATPYSKLVVDDDGRWQADLSRIHEARASRWARALALDGITAISPILMACGICHADLEGYFDPLDNGFWAAWCQPLLRRSDTVIIPQMYGWQDSRGVWREACHALCHNQPVFVIEEGAMP